MMKAQKEQRKTLDDITTCQCSSLFLLLSFSSTPGSFGPGVEAFLSAETWMCKLGNIVHELWQFVHSFSF